MDIGTSESFEGYIISKLFLETLVYLDSPFTKEKLIEAFSQYQAYDFHGLSLSFNSQTKELAQSVWIDAGENQWIKS